MAAMSASQSCAADCVSVSSTVCKSKVERLMTLSTSAVAVCCCKDSRSSFSSRTFSMAMTACVAKLLTSSICLSVNGRTSWRKMAIAPIRSSSLSMGTKLDPGDRPCFAVEICLIRREIDDMDYLLGLDHAAEEAGGPQGGALALLDQN